jgi:hypothetical protein
MRSHKRKPDLRQRMVLPKQPWERMPHGIVDHREGEYVVGAVNTNAIEGTLNVIKRRIMGWFHKVSRRYLWRYVNEFEFRYNHRENNDTIGAAIRAC